MGGGSEHMDVLGAILACGRRVTVVTGPARSGKTAAALGVYEKYLVDSAEPECLILAPNYLTCQWLRGELLARQPAGVLVAPRVMTFAALAGAIMGAAGAKAEPISPVRRRAVMEGIIAELASGGELAAVGGVADTPGLVRSVDRSISELKRAAIEPDALAGALTGAPAKHADLLAIYRAYQAYLHAHQLYDEEGRMWQARDELAAMPGVPLADLAAVVVDGFTDFTPTQLEILRLLSERVERLVITLPYDGDDGRGKLWHWTGRQLKRILAAFGDECERVHPPASHGGAVGGLLQAAFAVDPAPVAWPDGLDVVEAADPDSECRAITRWAKRLMAEGVRADELAVVGRQMAGFDATLHRIFRESGLPAPAPQRSLASTAVGRMLLAAVAMADRFAARDVLRVLGSSYLDPSRLGPFDATARDAAQLTIRQQNVLDGRDRYRPAAERLAEGIGRWAGSGDEQLATPQQSYLVELGPEAVTAAGELLEALFASVDPIAGGGSVPELAATCRRLLDTIVVPACADSDDAMVADDLRTWAALCAVLDDLASTIDAPGAARQLTAGQFGDVLSALLAETPARPVGERAAIRILGALDARAVRARHVWLLGLNEGAFPVAAGEPPLIAEADRRRWAEHSGLDLDLTDDLVAREMLLLYLTVSRADEGLTVSWHAADSAGHIAAASGFVEALLAAIDPSARTISHLPPAEFAPPPERIGCTRELRNAAMVAAADRTVPDAVAWDVARRRDLLAPLARPLWAAYRRWVPAMVDRYDGVLDDPVIVAEFDRRIPAEVVLSVSQLNTYLDCPWSWFAERSLKLTELVEPSDQLLPRRHGQLAHAVLRRLFVALTQDSDVAVTSLGGPDATAALDAAIEAEGAAAAGWVECRGLWESELRRLRRDLAAYLSRQADSPLPDQRVSKLELAFGMPVAADCDPASTAEPVVLDGPAGPVRLRGKIDRIDWIGTGEQARSFVIDYKTGALPDVKVDAQLPVYIKAAEEVLERPSAGGAVQRVGRAKPYQRDLAEFTLSRGKIKPNGDYAAQLDAAVATIHAAVAGMAAGRFGLSDGHGCAGVHCPFRRICGFSEIRVRVKAPDEQGGGDG